MDLPIANMIIEGFLEGYRKQAKKEDSERYASDMTKEIEEMEEEIGCIQYELMNKREKDDDPIRI